MSEVKICKTKCSRCKILSENKVRLKPATTFENNETEFDFNTDFVVNNIVYIKVNSNLLVNKADRTNFTTEKYWYSDFESKWCHLYLDFEVPEV